MTIEELMNLRIKLGISRAAVAKGTAYSDSSIYMYEKKARVAPYEFLTACEYFLKKELMKKKKQPLPQPQPKKRICLRELFGIN